VEVYRHQRHRGLGSAQITSALADLARAVIASATG
jgi:hypothetical protein